MAKKRQGVSSQQQRRAAKTRQQEQEGNDSRHDGTPSSSKSYIILRSTLPASSFIPAVALQILAVGFCLLLLHGRPSSFLSFNAYLRPLMYDTKHAMLKTLAGLLLVQLYFAMQLKLWSDRSTWKQKSANASEEEQEDASEDKQDTEVPSADKTGLPSSIQRFLQSVDFSRLDLASLPETLLGLALTSVLIFVMTILMGAPLARLLPETALYSGYLAVLAFTAPLHVLRPPYSTATDKIAVRSQWSRLFASFRPRSDIEIALLLPAYGAVIGSMIGVIPEGLDWEEPWQKWPVPCLLGSYVGWMIGQFATLGMCSILWLAKSGNQTRVGSGVASSTS